MTIQQHGSRCAALGTLLLGVVMGLTGCESKGPAQQAGENLDKGVQNVKDAITPAGPVEKAGQSVDKALGK